MSKFAIKYCYNYALHYEIQNQVNFEWVMQI